MVRKNCQSGRKYPSQTRTSIHIITIYQIKRATSDYMGVNDERLIREDNIQTTLMVFNFAGTKFRDYLNY